MDKFTDIDGVRLHYTDNGEGTPVVLMHGWGCNVTTVASIERVALAAGCRVINIDFPGFGRSSEPPTVWGVEEYTRLVEKLLQAEGVERPVMIGHSFGGRVGILYSSRNDVSKLILVDAAGVKPRRSLSYYIKVYSFKASRRLLPLLIGKKRAEARIEAARARRRVERLCVGDAAHASDIVEGGQRGPVSRDAVDKGADAADMGRERHGHTHRRRTAHGEPDRRGGAGVIPRMRPLQLS